MTNRDTASNAFSLIEVTLAVGVAAISLTVIFGLLPIGLQVSYNAIEQNVSADIMAAVVADLRATTPTSPRGGSATTTQFGISIPGNPVSSSSSTTLYFNSSGEIASSTDSRYRLTISFPSNGSSAKTATFVDLKMTWPAKANPVNSAGAAETFIALDRN